jgi:hypothetical protein
MITMSKLEKKLSWHTTTLENAIVLGTGFGHLSEILSLFKTVFVFAETVPQVKARNLIYRTDLTNLHLLSDISVMFVDLDHIKNLENYYSVWAGNKSILCIESSDKITSAVLTTNKYGMADQHKRFQVWKKA